jgi:formamidopyrimidine-DNA glycosylase
MPELPEVEVVRQSLNKIIKQKKVIKVIVRNRNLRIKIPINFKNLLENKKITNVDRFSKYLIFYLSNGTSCLLHLGMSGTIHIINYNKKNFITNSSFYHSQTLPKKHNHIEIFFDNFKIIYNDPRRFGFFQIISNNNLLKKRLAHLGPEPFHLKFNLKYVTSYLKGKQKNVKDFLLDQKFVSGIGNIYASEILFFSKINPHKKALKLKKKNLKKIIIFSKKVLLRAIKMGGSSIRDFRNITGNKGQFQKDFKVYGREGLNCQRPKCNGIIQKKTISKRSTFFCNTCQKK